MGPKVAFLLQGDDRVGAVADVLAKLADARINVVAMNAVAAGEGRFGAPTADASYSGARCSS